MPTLRKFSDIDLNFLAHPISGDVPKKLDASAVIRSVSNLVLTNYYDRPFHPEIGANIRSLLFENDDQNTRDLLRELIIEMVEAHEPRVTRIAVAVFTSEDIPNTYDVLIYLQVKGIIEPVDFTLSLERTR